MHMMSNDAPDLSEIKIEDMVRRIGRREHDRHGPVAVLALNHATAAMIDHETGTRPGIRLETWARYLREIIEADDVLAIYAVLHRLRSKAHWTPEPFVRALDGAVCLTEGRG